MTSRLISAQLDAHDTLIRACLDGTLGFRQFVAAYGDFPVAAAQAPAVESAVQRRIAFHRQVAGVLSGAPEIDPLIEPAVMMRLKHLAARYPEFISLV